MNRLRNTAAPPGTALPASLEARLAARVAGALSLNAQALPHELTERLRFGREKALARARELRVASAQAVVGVSGGGAALLAPSAFGGWWQRAASVVPLVVLVAGLVMIDRWLVHEQVLTAADIDAQILADDLPPAAYSDPGFVEFLRSPPPNP
jgi:Protein of unknown function (DUF3619)